MANNDDILCAVIQHRMVPKLLCVIFQIQIPTFFPDKPSASGHPAALNSTDGRFRDSSSMITRMRINGDLVTIPVGNMRRHASVHRRVRSSRNRTRESRPVPRKKYARRREMRGCTMNDDM
ncbi:uncharacterized protein LOC105830227 isoform X2 [Monomorium pharaonis]|uniref:uncharacterized protein LOC105830227 isoform X2 n=1 Tax=Monomorium pharaonis TaxID=307658 RepID=UPI00063F75D2|nr:uncharacterized protein LOC105830227 isoform X2 [Monomorium pharaonis]